MADIQGTFKIGDQEYSIAEIAGLNLAEIREIRQVRLPAGLYKFAIADCEFAKIDTKIDDKPAVALAIKVACEVKEVVAAFEWPTKAKITDSDELTNLIEKKHFETFMNKNDPVQMIGAFKAFLVDVGYTTGSTEQELMAVMQGCVGYEFMGMIKWSKNPNDPDMPYINLNRAKIAALETAGGKALKV